MAHVGVYGWKRKLRGFSNKYKTAIKTVMMGEDLILGKVAFTPKGEYVEGTAYERYDMVFSGLKIYVSLVDNNTHPLTNESAWVCHVRFDQVIGDMIADGAITGKKIADGAISEAKLDAQLLSVIAAGGGGGGGGIVLSDELGNSVLIGVTQHRITETFKGLLEQVNAVQQQLNMVANQKSSVTLSVKPEIITVGEEATVSLMAETDIEASSIVLMRDGKKVASDAGMTAMAEDIIQIEDSSEIVYEAVFTIGGAEKIVRRKVAAVLPIFYGAGTNEANAVNVASARVTPAGIYTVPVRSSLSHLFFVVPATMTINQVLMNGFEVKFGNPRITLMGGYTYKVYQSVHTYDTGTVIVNVS